MSLLLRKIARNSQLAAEVFGTSDPVTGVERPLVVVDADKLIASCFAERTFGTSATPAGCSSGGRRILVEFDRSQNLLGHADRRYDHGWLFDSKGPGPGLARRVRASLLVDQGRRTILPVATVYLELDEAGRVLGWPDIPPIAWSDHPSTKGLIEGDLVELLYPALVALERIDAEGDAIEAYTYRSRGDSSGSEDITRIEYIHVVPGPRP